MSSKEAEFITQWNGLLDYKIDEHNLRRPNFQFFYNALESLLRSLNFNIEKAKEEAANSTDVDRTYYIMFCGFVHRLYQLSDSSFKFYYFDLINPSKEVVFCTQLIHNFQFIQIFHLFSFIQRQKRVSMF